MRLSLEKSKTVHVPNDPDGGFIVIRKLSDEEIAAIEADTTAINVVGTNSGVVVNPYKRENGISRKCLKGWGHMYDLQGAELAFNSENIVKASNLSVSIDGEMVRFLKWVHDEHVIFSKEVMEEEKEAGKN